MLRAAFLISAIAAMLPVAAGAVTYVGIPGNPDPGAPGQILLVDFETPVSAPYTLTGDYGIVNTTTSSASAPAGDSSYYLYVSTGLPTASATLTTTDLSAISFYWGTIDAFNSVDVLLAGGGVYTLSGSVFPPSNGSQTFKGTNRRVFFTAGAGEVITGLRFNTTGVAFEVDDIYGTIAGTGSDVPEPATWAMLIAGFGLIGAANRRRRMASVSA